PTASARLQRAQAVGVLPRAGRDLTARAAPELGRRRRAPEALFADAAPSAPFTLCPSTTDAVAAR
ncbi:hypothetical protein AB0A81_41370, partial [Streptomyces flaveolus]